MKEIVIIDYNIGNVDSVVSAVRYLGHKPLLSNKKNIIENAKKLILPGQGSFDFGMKRIEELEILDLIKKKILKDKVSTLGICLGMHLFAEFGYENNKKTEGLSCIKGEVKKIESNLRLPNIGWNENFIIKKDKILEGIKDESDFYYAHSFYFNCEEENVISESIYGNKFPSIIKKDNIYGFQFHPEKSLQNGLKILNNFINI